MIDGVILMAILIPAIMVVFTFFLDILTSTGGTKGITAPYITKSGQSRTAKVSRQDHIV